MKVCAAGVVQTVVMARYMLDWRGDSHAAPRLTVFIHGRSVSLNAELTGVTARVCLRLSVGEPARRHGFVLAAVRDRAVLQTAWPSTIDVE
ncbi:MAG: hypothetical protein FD120_1873 [Gammaproteobacteria bacterium]|nr:MAG: hypothetical protein FD120_1873 [Gammaproteobacteria bacterium]